MLPAKSHIFQQHEHFHYGRVLVVQALSGSTLFSKIPRMLYMGRKKNQRHQPFSNRMSRGAAGPLVRLSRLPLEGRDVVSNRSIGDRRLSKNDLGHHSLIFMVQEMAME
jgi:hypothetical protein